MMTLDNIIRWAFDPRGNTLKLFEELNVGESPLSRAHVALDVSLSLKCAESQSDKTLDVQGLVTRESPIIFHEFTYGFWVSNELKVIFSELFLLVLLVSKQNFVHLLLKIHLSLTPKFFGWIEKCNWDSIKVMKIIMHEIEPKCIIIRHI